jgi:hypothetical protein
MKYTVCYTKTYSVEIDADSVDSAVEIWEDMDLDAIEFEEPSPEIQHVEWQDSNGNWKNQLY